MKRMILAALVLLFGVGSADAGVVKVATYPLRHPKKVAHAVNHVVVKPAKKVLY